MLQPDIWLRALQSMPLSNTERALLKLVKTVLLCGILAAATELVNVLASPDALTINTIRTVLVGAFLKGTYDAVMKLFARDGAGAALVGQTNAALIEAGATAVAERLGVNDVKVPRPEYKGLPPFGSVQVNPTADPPVADGTPSPVEPTA